MTVSGKFDTAVTRHSTPGEHLTPGALSLINDGSHWTGSFYLLVRTLIADQLKDAPIGVLIFHMDLKDDGIVWRTEGIVTAVSDNRVTFNDGMYVHIEKMLAVSI